MFCCCCPLIITAFVVIFISFLIFKTFIRNLKIPSLKDQHVLITGGSSGIGKCCAIEVFKRGASVTIFARDKQRLEETKADVKRYCVNGDTQKINVFSVDITGDYNSIENAVQQAQEALGPIDVLINCAGFAIASKLEDIPIKDIYRLMNVNFMGSCLVTRAVLPSMKSRSNGRIVLTSSQAGLFGVYGYSVYAAAKFALRGFAEVLQSEVLPYNISVTLAVPPDTDTPGFAEEEKTKPLATKLISESGGLFSAEDVAKNIVKDMLERKFFSITGFDGKMLSIICAGMSPVSSFFELILQVALMGPLRLVSTYYLHTFKNVILKCHERK